MFTTSFFVTSGIFCAVAFLAFHVVEAECPEDSTPVGKSTCLSHFFIHGRKEAMENDCKNRGGELGGPFPDDVWTDFSEYVKKKVLSRMEFFKLWVEIEKKESDDGKWKYVFDDEEFDPDDFPLFERKPKEDEGCAYIAPADSKVIPANCEERFDTYCQKNEAPCKNGEYTTYIDYYGICIATRVSSLSYDHVTRSCQEDGGDMLVLKNETVLQSALAAVFNLGFCGGVYTGLEKNANGEWVYLDGSPGPPDSLWDENDPREENCAFLRANADFSLNYISLNCDEKCAYICRYPAME